MEAGNKRKRDLECPRITYHAPGRTFDRLFREDSLAQLQEIVRQKLGLQSDAVIKLSQVRGTADVDLEDEDDFDAFYNAAHSASTASIRVTIQTGTVAGDTRKDELGLTHARKKRKLDDVSQPVVFQASSNLTEAPPISTPAASRKRLASQSDAKMSSDGAQTGEPSVKRSKVTPTDQSTQSLETRVPQSAALTKQSEMLDGGKAAPKKITNPTTTLASPRASDSLTQAGMDGKKPTKPKSKKSSVLPNIPITAAALGIKSRKEILEEQAKAEKQTKQKKDKAKSKEREDEKDRDEASPVQPSLAKETKTVVSSEGTNGQKDAKSKSKKTKSSTSKDTPQADSVASASKKKVLKSKPKVREATTGSVDSETNDTLDPDAQSKGSLVAISRLMIEKYLTPTPSAVDVDSAKPTKEVARIASAVQNTSTNPTCPYCGKALTHDRSRCPLIRAKLLDTIEKRIEDLRKDENEDTGSIRSHAIEVLEAALRKKRGAEAKKEQSPKVNNDNVSCPAMLPSLDIPPNSVITRTGSTTKPTPTRRSLSSTSSDSSDGDDPLNNDDPSHLSTLHRNLSYHGPASHLLAPRKISLRRSDVFKYTSQSDSDTEGSSEDEVPPPRTDTMPQPVSLLPQESDSQSSSSSEDESTTPSRGQHLLPSESHPTLPSLTDAPGYSDKDLEALIRGPGVPLKSTDLPSSDSSEDEESDDVQLDNESEQEEPSSHSRKARQSFAMNNDSSDEDVDANGDNESEPSYAPLARASVPPPIVLSEQNDTETCPIPEPSQENRSFQQMNGRPDSVEADKAGNEAFEEILARENAVFDLAGKELTPPPPKQVIPEPPVATSHPSPLPDQSKGGEKEQDPLEKESNTLGIENGAVGTVQEEDIEEGPEASKTLVPDPIEVDEVSNVPNSASNSPVKGTEDDEAPSTPPPPSEPAREEPARASTPKPGIFQRMRNRVGLASPTKKQDSTSSSLPTPVAKTPMRAAPSRIQQKPRTKSQTVGLGQNGNGVDADAETATPIPNVKPALKKGAASTSKPVSTRAKVAAKKNPERVEEDQEGSHLPPRRSARTLSKSASATSVIPDVLPASSQPSTRKTRQIKAAAVTKEAAKKPVKATRKPKTDEANAAVKSLTPPPANEDTDVNTPGSQSAKQKLALPPSSPVSLNAWATIQTETPLDITQSDPMVDELQSDVDPITFPLKPQHRRKTPFGRKESVSRLEQAVQDMKDKEGDKNKEKESPLFIPSESQTVFPYSQLEADAPASADTESSDSEEEVRATVVKQVTRSQSQSSRYRTLSDIASQATKLFTPKLLRQSTTQLQSAQSAPNTRKDRLGRFYGKRWGENGGDDDSDDDSGQGSDSDAGQTSHIPKSRKAGPGLKSRMSVA